tara:strand:- start:853 stop:1449 length:597 start_codon:yes stop_codon:yes gene_type:complete
VSTLAGADDVVVTLVKDFVNDAKHLVEDSHQWNALRNEWTISTVAGTDNYSLTGAGNYARIEYILMANGQYVTEQRLQLLRQLSSEDPTQQQTPTYYSVNGIDASGDLRLKVYPNPDAVYALNVYGFKRQADLVADNDVLLTPSKPVLYYALALAARERGEVGGQTAAEVFSLAQQYTSNAVALDATMNDLDNIWMTV